MIKGVARKQYSGRPIRRVEDERFLRGSGRYLDDINRANQLHAAFLRSSYANARIRAIDVARAQSAVGVRLVLTGSDLGSRNAPLPLIESSPCLTTAKTQLPLASERVHYVGEAIACVVADNRYLAEDAVGLIEVEYEPREAVVDLDSADSVVASVHDDVPGNLACILEDSIGDVDAAFQAAEFVEVLDLSIERSCSSPIEPRGLIADWDRLERRLRVWDSTQAPVAIKHGLCRLLGLSEEQVDVMAPDVGGGFGTKVMLFYPEELVLPLAAMQLARPVKWVEDRWEHFVSATQERGQMHHAEVAFDATGKILAVRTAFLHDTGAFIPYGLAVPANTVSHLLGQYKIRNFSATGRILYTNKPPVTPFRGAGRPQAVFVMERLLSAVAKRLNLEPHEIRSRNLIQPDDFPYEVGLRTEAPVRYDSGNYVMALAEVVGLIDPLGFREKQAAARQHGRHLGLGIATFVQATGPGAYESCRARMTETGHVLLNTAVASQGQGHETTFGQIAADEFGLPLECVVVRGGDSSQVEDGLGTFGSRSLLLAGNAVANAVSSLRRQMVDWAAWLMECDASDIAIQDGWVQVAGTPASRVSLSALVALANPFSYPAQRASLDNPRTLERLKRRVKDRSDIRPIFEARGYFGLPQQAYGSGVHGAIVDVDISTGQTRILRYVAVHDCGIMINPAIVKGQILGGLAQGIGGALFERLVFDRGGQPLVTSLMDFHMPTADDMPPVEVVHIETPSPLNPLGVKGTGEAGIIPVSAVIAEAIEDALAPFGILITQMPIFPADIRALLTVAGVPSQAALTY